MIFKMYDCDFGFTYNGVNYDFTHVESVVIEDPETTKLIRGSNSGNKTGIVYREGIKEPKTMTLTILGIEKSMHELLKTIYKDQARVDAYVVSRVDGSSKIAKNAVLSQEPKQLTMDDSPESMNTALMFQSFDVSEIMKA